MEIGKREMTDGFELTNVTIEDSEIPSSLPVLPGRDIVPFPGVMIALHLEQPGSLRVVEDAMAKDGLVLIVAQRNSLVEDPEISDLYRYGVVARVLRLLKYSDSRTKVLLQGLRRAKVAEYSVEGTFSAALSLPEPREVDEEKGRELLEKIQTDLQTLVEHEHLPEEMLLLIQDETSLERVGDALLAHHRLEVALAQRALEEEDPIERLQTCAELLDDELRRLYVTEQIRERAQDEMQKGQVEFYLREQIKQIQEQLGDTSAASQETEQLHEALRKSKLSKEARAEFEKQLNRLERIPTESTEFALLRTYLEWIIDLPWNKRSRQRVDLKKAKRILDKDHFGLEKAKERILEYLAVRKLNPSLKGQILCFIGPPGVGKTSLGKSIARALGRSFFRMSLGGVRDEAEIRGHRRTYVGALPGRILQGIKQAKTINPVFLLDELDKVGSDFRGDPASALLEVLDPQQNKEFRDHYLNLPFDLSEVLFIATANTLDTIPDALLDRLEIIYLSGYTLEEKEKIAKDFIIPRQKKTCGLKEFQISFREDAIRFLIERYTSEAGVRGLEREIAAFFRKLARQYVESKKTLRRVSISAIERLLGPTKYDPELRDTRDLVGLARGLAWTVNGGELMPVEVSVAKGGGNLALTGQLGSVMQESAQAAVFYARAHAEELKLKATFHQDLDIHVHVPSGATPKDGPSAGITIACALVSALTGRPVSSVVAMTGEATLGGMVIAVGGLKEKVLAAIRQDIQKVIIPFENVKDLEEIPKAQRDKIEFIPVRYVAEVFEHALLPKPRKSRAKTASKKVPAAPKKRAAKRKA